MDDFTTLPEVRNLREGWLTALTRIQKCATIGSRSRAWLQRLIKYQ
jgi:hypothetical protein